jgi:hypothetical protein
MARVRHLIQKPGPAGGGPRWYWQPPTALRAAGWRMQRLPDELGAAVARAEQLNREVDAWRAGQPEPGAPPAAVRRGRAAVPGTVEHLVAAYRASRWWTKLRATTQASYGYCLDAIVEWAGDQPVRAITSQAVQAFYDAQLRRVEGKGRKRRVIETPARAAAAVRVLRLLLQVGVRLGYVTTNAALRPGISLARAREPVVWTPEQVRHIAAVADALGWRSVATAVLLNEWIGQREADILQLRPWAVEEEALRIRQGKTGRVVVLPVYLVPHLVARLRAERERPGAEASPKLLLPHEGTREAWKRHTFAHRFAAIREAASAGLPEHGLPAMPSCARLLFMELRHTAVTRLHAAGCDALAISRITGHAPDTAKAIIDRHYLGETEAGAAEAFRKRLKSEFDGAV